MRDFKLVPVEPTEGMLEAGRLHMAMTAKDTYELMLAAAPPLDADAVREMVTEEVVLDACRAANIQLDDAVTGTARIIIEAALTALLFAPSREEEGK